MLQALSGMSFGVMIGSVFDGSTGPSWNQAFIQLLNFGSGLFINSQTSNLVVRFIIWISPFRYAVEALLRTMLVDKLYGDKILE